MKHGVKRERARAFIVVYWRNLRIPSHRVLVQHDDGCFYSEKKLPRQWSWAYRDMKNMLCWIWSKTCNKIAKTYCTTTSSGKKAKPGKERIAHFARHINLPLLLSQRIEKMKMANSSEHASPLLVLTSGSEEVLEYKIHAPPSIIMSWFWESQPHDNFGTLTSKMVEKKGGGGRFFFTMLLLWCHLIHTTRTVYLIHLRHQH